MPYGAFAMLTSLVLIAVAVGAAVRLGGGLAVVALAAAAVQLLTWRHNRRLTSRAARLLPVGRRGRRAQQLRAAESTAALVGVALLVWSFFD
jgi:hypothetical protein